MEGGELRFGSEVTNQLMETIGRKGEGRDLKQK